MTREEAIKVINNHLKNWERLLREKICDETDGTETISAFIIAIEALKQNAWIPIDERLPKESINSVIGWDACRERCVFVQYWEGHFQITGKPESFDIKAWMPLPEPYKAESDPG